MPTPVITITRQYGSGGSEVASLVAATLTWDLVDNQFVDEVARRAGLPVHEVALLDERAPRLLERVARAMALASPELFLSAATEPAGAGDEGTIVRMTERIIEEAAAHGRSVLVGRGAQALLARRPDALHVYTVASTPWRIAHASAQLSLDRPSAARLLEDTDARRDAYVRTHYGRSRADLTTYDAVLNTERLGIEGAAALIVAEARRRRWD